MNAAGVAPSLVRIALASALMFHSNVPARRSVAQPALGLPRAPVENVFRLIGKLVLRRPLIDNLRGLPAPLKLNVLKLPAGGKWDVNVTTIGIGHAEISFLGKPSIHTLVQIFVTKYL